MKEWLQNVTIIMFVSCPFIVMTWLLQLCIFTLYLLRKKILQLFCINELSCLNNTNERVFSFPLLSILTYEKFIKWGFKCSILTTFI